MADGNNSEEIHKLELKIGTLEVMLKQSITNQNSLMVKVETLIEEVSNHRILENRVNTLEKRHENSSKILYSVLTALAVYMVSTVLGIRI